jgi:predicted PurR-regulated permease PerM
MAESAEARRFARVFLLLLTLGISALFFGMVKGFLSAVLFAAILAGMTTPVYRRVLSWVRGRQALASGITVLLVLLVIIIPATVLIGIVASEAVGVSQQVAPWVQEHAGRPDELDRLFARIPFADRLAPYKDHIMSKGAELVGRVGSFLVSRVAAVTRGTAVFFFQLFITLYAMFFFLMDGRAGLDRILYYIPLPSQSEYRMVDRFLSVARATLKGTLFIGLIQGALGGLALAAAGVQGAVFWGTIMAVLSIIPGVGGALVWVPAVIVLFASGRPVAAILVTLWCAGVVGSVDNVLRPRMVGKDTKMSDLMILLGTLGGLTMFGAAGIVIGPIVAALFITVWELYAEAFSDVLPAVHPRNTPAAQ